MIRVAITTELIENTLKSGFKMGSLIEVINGLPSSVQLARAEFSREKGLLYLYFSQPTVPDSELSDLAITLKSVKAVPIDLEKAPTPAPRHAPITVERNIG